jgi:hypothetical protein
MLGQVRVASLWPERRIRHRPRGYLHRRSRVLSPRRTYGCQMDVYDSERLSGLLETANSEWQCVPMTGGNR